MKGTDFKEFKGKTRAVNLLHIYKFIKKKQGTIGRDNFIELVKKKYPEIPNPSKMKDKYWFPLYYEFVLHDELCEFLNRDDQKVSFALGRFSAHDIGALSFFVKFVMNPNSLAKKASTDWNQYYDFGGIDITTNKPGLIELNLVDMPYFELYDHNIHGFFTAVMELTDTKNYTVDKIGKYHYVIKW